MNTHANRFQLPAPPTANSVVRPGTSLIDQTPIEESAALNELATSLEADLASLESRFEHFVTRNSQKRNAGR